MPTVYRPARSQKYQMGKETSPGVGGTAEYRFPTLNFGLVPAGDPSTQTRHAGGKYVGAVLSGDTWSEGALGGGANQNIIDFNETVFLASSNIGNPTPTASGAAITRVYEPVTDDVDTALTYKVQRGRTGAVKGFTNVVIPDLGFRFVRRGASTVTGRALGKKMAPGASLDSATGIAQQSLASTKTGLYVPTTFGGTLSGHRFDPMGFVCEWHQNGKLAPWFALDDSVIGPKDFIEQEVDTGGTITVAFDINDGGTDLRGPFNMANWEGGIPFFVTVLNLGPVVPGTAIPHKLQFDMCIILSAPPTESTTDGIEAYTWPYICVPDATTGLPFRLTNVSSVPIAATN